MMTFDEAVEIVKNYGNGFLLDGLELIRDEMDQEEYEEVEAQITPKQRLAYYKVVKDMCPLFV